MAFSLTSSCPVATALSVQVDLVGRSVQFFKAVAPWVPTLSPSLLCQRYDGDIADLGLTLSYDEDVMGQVGRLLWVNAFSSSVSSEASPTLGAVPKRRLSGLFPSPCPFPWPALPGGRASLLPFPVDLACVCSTLPVLRSLALLRSHSGSFLMGAVTRKDCDLEGGGPLTESCHRSNSSQRAE